MQSPWDRLTAVSTYGPSGFEEEDEPDFGWDFSGLGNPSAMRDFMTACDYCLSDCSDGSRSFGDGDCGPSRECFHVDLGGPDEGNYLGIPENCDPPRPTPRVDILRELAVVPVPAGVRTHSSSKSAGCRPGHPAPHCRRRQGKAATGFQWGRPKPGYSSNTSRPRRSLHSSNIRSLSTPSSATSGLPRSSWTEQQPQDHLRRDPRAPTD
jgi:hypothetical protein